MEDFCAMLSRLKTKEAIRDFLKDLMNREERLMLIRRLLIADMLNSGKTYKEIIEELKCGEPTIARVKRWLHFGRRGYKQAITAKHR